LPVKARRARRAAARRKQVRALPSAPAQPDVAAESRALLDAGESRHPEADARGEGSVQDPLQDWPESSGERDAWIAERRERDERQDR
jgi:hypothetical protein